MGAKLGAKGSKLGAKVDAKSIKNRVGAAGAFREAKGPPRKAERGRFGSHFGSNAALKSIRYHPRRHSKINAKTKRKFDTEGLQNGVKMIQEMCEFLKCACLGGFAEITVLLQ